MPPRTIVDHKVNGLNEALIIEVLDRPGPGNACHQYRIRHAVPQQNESSFAPVGICFQNGPIQEVGVNGISNEALIAVVLDRLRGFQSGDFKCRENAVALTHFEEGLMWLQKRTRDRIARGVEGTNQK